MNRIVRAVTLSVLWTASGAAAELRLQPDDEAGRPGLTVRIYDYAELSGRSLRRAAEAARNVYRMVGIETRWIRCRVSLDVPEMDPDCETEPGTMVLQMRILPKIMAERFGLDEGVFGFALPPRKGGFGNVASIFYERVRMLAATSRTPAEVILGHMLAHEAGHLLLGVGSHSSSGIMHVPWKVDDLQRAEVGRLKFTGEQAERMRRHVTDRWKVEADTVPAVRADYGVPDSTM